MWMFKHTVESKQMQAYICGDIGTHILKGLFTGCSFTYMTHKQLPFSPMKGDLFSWHGTSRCITKPHSLIMAVASFSYTGKHLLIFVTGALSLKVLTFHLGAQISRLIELLCGSCFILEHRCTISAPCTALLHVSRAVCQPGPIAKN